MSTVEAADAMVPPLIGRWLHGGPALDDITSLPLAGTLSASSTAQTSAKASDSATSSVWRSFTDSEEKRLEAAWQNLDVDTREKAWRFKITTKADKDPSKHDDIADICSASKDGGINDRRKPDSDIEKAEAVKNAESAGSSKSKAEQAQESYIADPEKESQPHIVHVSQDNLFSADLRSLVLYPVFWKGARIGIQRATWFYPSTSSHKFYPVDPLLAHHLEEAYFAIEPYKESYSDELRSAVALGAEAEGKLKHMMPEVGVDVIFQDKSSARIYARHLPARLSKSFLTSLLRDKGTAGGTLVYRGFDTLCAHLPKKKRKAAAMKDKIEEKSESMRRKASVASVRSSSTTMRQTNAVDTDSESEQTAESRPATPANASNSTASKGRGALSSLFSWSASTKTNAESLDEAEHGDDNTTAEAMQGDQAKEDGSDEPELAELVLIVHGIGQKLATTYDSFNIVHAINQLRKLCIKQSEDPAIREVIGNKRLQFIPLQWRSSLQFDEMLEDDDDKASQLDNRFALNDIQVQGAIPFVRSLMTGVAMDLGFYLSHHRDKMTAAVTRDANRIYRLFRERNPGYNGKVSIIAHSLGTALATDILSRQPTWVPDLRELPSEKQRSDEQLLFNVSSLFFLGSPVGYMFFLNRAQLIARKGRKRTHNVPPEVALDRAGKYGCMAVDSLYNVYNTVDPFACCLNACVDAEYSKIVKPVPISSVTSSMTSGYTAAVSGFISNWMPSFGTSSKTSKPDDKAANTGQPPDASIKTEPDHEQKALEEDMRPKRPVMPSRPKTKRQITSEMDRAGLKRFERAEARMLALNPQGSIDFYLSPEGFSQYYDMILSHASYWHDARFATFILTQLLASSDKIEKAKVQREAAEDAEAEAALQADARTPHGDLAKVE